MSPGPPVALIILDGWGLAPPGEGNAITLGATPFIDSLMTAYPHTALACAGEAVGLPAGQMGNSEVGHLNLGAGRVVHQDIVRINRAIASGELATNPALLRALERTRGSGGTLHLLGLLSDGGVHSLQSHLYALIQAAEQKGVERIRVHAFLDGRDTPPNSGAGYLRQLQDFLRDNQGAALATIAGRYWAMDRDKRWERVKVAYDAMVRGQGPTAADPVAAVQEAYRRGEYDEFITPTVVVDGQNQPVGRIADGDAVVFFNFRADRAREMTWALWQPGFDGFAVADRPRLVDYVCLTQYDEDLDVPVAFGPLKIENTLAQVVSRAGMRQLHIAETEKYAHVTFFFNGGVEEAFAGEDRVLIPSPQDVQTYDQRPQMSAYEVTAEAIKRVQSRAYELIVMNYANGDMVGHTGILAAAVAAVEAVDQCLAQVIPAVLAVGGRVVLTADHGNAEQMVYPETGAPYTAHSVDNPVPLVLIDPQRATSPLRAGGALCDVAPTVLELLDLEQPPQMTGRSLLEVAS